MSSRIIVLAPIVLLLAIAAGIYYYARLRSDDGATCSRDVDCVRRTCIEDVSGTYCSRPCSVDSECMEGWRCLPPPGARRRPTSCLRPR